MAMCTAALVHALCRAAPLRGGSFNVDPLLVCSRRSLRGAPVRMLLAFSVLHAGHAAPQGRGHVPTQVAEAVNRMRDADLHMQLTISGSAPSLEVEQSAAHVLAPDFVAPQPGNGQLREEDSSDDPALLFTVRVYMYQRPDHLTTLWFEPGDDEESIFEAIRRDVVEDGQDYCVQALCPQLPDDTMSVTVTPAWWRRSNMTHVILDLSAMGREPFLCVLPRHCCYNDLRRAFGTKWVSGTTLRMGNEPTAIDGTFQRTIRDGTTFRLHPEDREFLILNTVDEAMRDRRWRRDVENLGMPQVRSAESYVLVLGPRTNFTMRMRHTMNVC